MSSSIQYNGGDRHQNHVAYTPYYCQCQRISPIRITQGDRGNKGRLFFKCDACNHFSWCEPAGGLPSAIDRGFEPNISGNINTCGCLALAERMKSIEIIVCFMKMVIVALFVVGILALFTK